jgi:hypothetical protein
MRCEVKLRAQGGFQLQLGNEEASMQRSWLKYLNPFHFENWQLLVAVFRGIPKESALFSHLAVPADRLEAMDVVKQRELLMRQDSYMRGMMSDFLSFEQGLAFLFCALSVILLLNSLCMYQAYRSLKGAGPERQL